MKKKARTIEIGKVTVTIPSYSEDPLCYQLRQASVDEFAYKARARQTEEEYEGYSIPPCNDIRLLRAESNIFLASVRTRHKDNDGV